MSKLFTHRFRLADWALKNWGVNPVEESFNLNLAPAIHGRFYKIRIYSIHFIWGSFGIVETDATEPAMANWNMIVQPFILRNKEWIASTRHRVIRHPILKPLYDLVGGPLNNADATDQAQQLEQSTAIETLTEIRDTHWIFPKGIDFEGELWITIAEGGAYNIASYSATVPSCFVSVEYEVEEIPYPQSWNVWARIVNRLKGRSGFLG